MNDRTSMKYTIPKIKMLCNLRRLKVRLRLLSTAQQPELRFKTAKVMQHFYFWNGVLLTRVTVDFNDLKVLPSKLDRSLSKIDVLWEKIAGLIGFSRAVVF